MRFPLLLALAATACFSKPGFNGRDAGAGDDAVTDGSLPPPPTGIARISAGLKHACRIDGQARLICWGDNASAQLARDTPGAPWTGTPDVAALPSGWTAVAAGGAHTCGIRGGQVYCWGGNASGQSDPATAGNPVLWANAVALAVPGTAEKIFAGEAITCAINTDHEAYCWGDLDFDFGSDGITRLSNVGFTQLALSEAHACGIAMDGRIHCWGKNPMLQLGREGSDLAFAAAMPIDDPSAFSSIAAGRYATCATTQAGHLACWGDATNGQLGDTAVSSEFRIVDATRTWTHVAMGIDHTCAVGDGELFCYGKNYLGALGDGQVRDRLTLGSPVPVGVPVRELVANRGYTCALGNDGEAVRCWGSNSKGELGNGQASRKTSPVPVAFPTAAVGTVNQIVAGDDHSCALIGQTAWCWGLNQRGQVGVTGPLIQSIPVQASPKAFANLAAGARHTCGLVQGSEIECWGDNNSNQLGTASVVTRNAVTPPTNQWSFVAAGSTTTCGIDSGELHCWGHRIGTGQTDVTPFDYGAPGTGAWVAISIGSGFAVGVIQDGADYTIASFGDRCPAGHPDGAPLTTPLTTSMISASTVLPRVAAAQNGGAHTCVHHDVTGVDTLTCWGRNGSGQLGSPAMASGCHGPVSVTPPQGGWHFVGSSRATLLTSNDHSCALDDHVGASGPGRIVCWGLNANWELAAANNGTPALANPGTWSSIVGGRDHSCGINTGDGRVYCWGENQFGQVGDGSQYQPSPVVAGVVEP